MTQENHRLLVRSPQNITAQKYGEQICNSDAKEMDLSRWPRKCTYPFVPLKINFQVKEGEVNAQEHIFGKV
jgi:hypothetical protein